MSGRGIAGLLLIAIAVGAGCASPTRWHLPPLPPLSEVVVRPNPNVTLTGASSTNPVQSRYLQRMFDAVQAQWEHILVESRTYPRSGTQVAVVFRLGADGAVREVVSVEGDAGKQAEKACVSAIVMRPSYGEWTGEMKSDLGEVQELTFAFHYQ